MIDGVGDISDLTLNSKRTLLNHSLEKTPLQAAQIPYMNAIAKSGLCGIHDPVQSGLGCGSDTAHMSIFGYDPLQLYK